MHPRQRSPRGFYASEYRHLNRDASFGRGHGNPKSFSQPPPPPPPLPPPSSSRRAAGGGGDVFMEAGRLAAEYLVSQGLLPPNVLSLKWHNHNGGGFKKHGGGEVPVEGGRTSALARLGNAVPADGPSGRRKLGFDEFGQKGRRRGSFRSNGLDWGREFRRNGSWSDRYRATPDIKDDDDDDSVTRQQDEEQQQAGGGGDNVSQKSNSDDFVPGSEEGNDLDAETDKDPVSGELLDLKQSSSGAGKDAYSVDMELVESSNDLENTSAGVKEVKDGTCDDDIEKSSISKNLSVQSSVQENNSPSRGGFTDLLSLCKPFNVPTKTRSSLTRKNLKVDPRRNNGDENTHDMGGVEGPEVLAENESVKGSYSGDLLTDRTYDLEHLDSDVAKVEPVHAAENTKELDTACNAEEVKSIGSQSGQDRGCIHDNHESSAALPEYGSCSSVAEERGEKRVAEADDVREETKRLREWLPSLVPRPEEYLLHNNPIGMKESPREEDEISPIDKVTATSGQGSLMSIPRFTQGGDRPFLQCSEEKKSLPSSFRTCDLNCDLNLIESSEVHENHADHPILIYPPVSETKKAVPVDIDLSMSHTSVSGKFSTPATSGKEIEVIDLENDSTQEVKSIGNMERKTETMFPGLEGFSNHAQNTADLHDVQDGYGLMISDGLMISELLGTDFPNCSSVPSDINSVHNEMGLHNGTGTLAEDDSIYMSLGEIPLSFLRTWEQPPSQDYQKPF